MHVTCSKVVQMEPKSPQNQCNRFLRAKETQRNAQNTKTFPCRDSNPGREGIQSPHFAVLALRTSYPNRLDYMGVDVQRQDLGSYIRSSNGPYRDTNALLPVCCMYETLTAMLVVQPSTQQLDCVGLMVVDAWELQKDLTILRAVPGPSLNWPKPRHAEAKVGLKGPTLHGGGNAACALLFCLFDCCYPEGLLQARTPWAHATEQQPPLPICAPCPP
jgi:hypothetical protein